ncbi:hypothetical protein AB3S75_027610 [Citrus x aurantiifolia]
MDRIEEDTFKAEVFHCHSKKKKMDLKKKEVVRLKPTLFADEDHVYVF